MRKRGECMQNGEFIKDRWIVGMVKDACREMGVEVRSFSDNWVMELTKGGRSSTVFGYKFGLNNSASASIVQDKVASYLLMTSHGIPAVEHYLIRGMDKSLWDQLPLQKNMVAKPLVGTGGRGVALYADRARAEQAVKASAVEAWALSPYYDIKREIRCVILDGEILLSYEKRPIERDGMKFFNLGMGAVPVDHHPSESMQRLAMNAMKALGLRVGAVDSIVCYDGTIMVLEVNDGVMMESFARHSKANKQKAAEIYKAIITTQLAS